MNSKPINVFCGGDSFCAGAEILDYLLPGWPGYSTTGSVYAKDADKKWSSVRFARAVSYFKSPEKILEEEKLAAWPGQLSKIDSNIRVVNYGLNGASITGIAHRTLLGLLQNKDTKFDFVFIQLTGPMRVEFYKSSHVKRNFINDRALGWLETLENQTEREIATKYVGYYRDEDFSIKYLYTLANLRYMVRGLTGLDPILVGSYRSWHNHILDPLTSNSRLSEDPTIKTLIENSGILNLTEEDFMETTQVKNNFMYTPLKHFEIRCHEEFAKSLINRYIK